MPSIGGYHPYGLGSILTGLESIEHVLDKLGRRIAARQLLPPVYRNFGALLDEWCNIPQDQILNLILKACLGVNEQILQIERKHAREKRIKWNNRVMLRSDDVDNKIRGIAEDRRRNVVI
ncbi:hypothetical protein TNCV_3817801 [Trichonephila clavipes]|nr:hypothetical protein TNCV_3817801 [Trichonephila clavipes]